MMVSGRSGRTARLREFAHALRGELNGFERKPAGCCRAYEGNSRNRRRRETADRMNRLADGAGRYLMMRRLVLIAGRDRRAARCEAEILDDIGAERPGKGHARGMMEDRDQRLQQ